MSPAHPRRPLRTALTLLSLCLFLVGGGLLLKNAWETARTQSAVAALKTAVPSQPTPPPLSSTAPALLPALLPAAPSQPPAPPPLPDCAALRRRNPDLFGWITIPNTRIDYPIMHTPGSKGEEFYLRRNFFGEYDLGGLPFLDARCTADPPAQILTVYGHNLSSGIMFHDLLRYRKQSFCAANPEITLYTPTETRTYRVFSALLYDASSPSDAFKPHGYTAFDTPAQLDDYLRQLAVSALYVTDDPPVFGDRLLLLATCDRRSLENGRMVVLAKQTE
ncbi:MAG: class B sortase [Oscillospiraceae bacterium]